MPFLKQTPHFNKPIPKHTFGKAVPTSGRRGCLSPDGTTYGKQYCKGYLYNQGIGTIEGIPVPYTRAFSRAFSSAFG